MLSTDMPFFSGNKMTRSNPNVLVMDCGVCPDDRLMNVRWADIGLRATLEVRSVTCLDGVISASDDRNLMMMLCAFSPFVCRSKKQTKSDTPIYFMCSNVGNIIGLDNEEQLVRVRNPTTFMKA